MTTAIIILRPIPRLGRLGRDGGGAELLLIPRTRRCTARACRASGPPAPRSGARGSSGARRTRGRSPRARECRAASGRSGPRPESSRDRPAWRSCPARRRGASALVGEAHVTRHLVVERRQQVLVVQRAAAAQAFQVRDQPSEEAEQDWQQQQQERDSQARQRVGLHRLLTPHTPPEDFTPRSFADGQCPLRGHNVLRKKRVYRKEERIYVTARCAPSREASSVAPRLAKSELCCGLHAKC